MNSAPPRAKHIMRAAQPFGRPRDSAASFAGNAIAYAARSFETTGTTGALTGITTYFDPFSLPNGLLRTNDLVDGGQIVLC